MARYAYEIARPLPPFDELKVADVMRPGVITCHPSAPLFTVAERMALHGIHALIVAGITRDFLQGDRLAWGVVSDLDLVSAFPAGLEGHSAAEVTRRDAVMIEPSAPVVTAAALMVKHQTAHLVVAEDGEPIGVVSTLDLINGAARANR